MLVVSTMLRQQRKMAGAVHTVSELVAGSPNLSLSQSLLVPETRRCTSFPVEAQVTLQCRGRSSRKRGFQIWWWTGGLRLRRDSPSNESISLQWQERNRAMVMSACTSEQLGQAG